VKKASEILLFCLVSACVTVGSVQPASGESTFEVRGKSYEEVWKASVRAMSNNLIIVENDKDSGSIKSKAPVSLTSWGEIVRLVIEPTTATADVYTVEVVSKKRIPGQISGQNWEPSVIVNIEAELGI
jgi:hypothetical protein